MWEADASMGDRAIRSIHAGDRNSGQVQQGVLLDARPGLSAGYPGVRGSLLGVSEGRRIVDGNRTWRSISPS